MADRIPTARDVMVEGIVTFSPETPILEAIRTLLSRRISGGPVIDAEGRMVGILSEKDCLKLLAEGAFHGVPEGLRVRDHMTTEVRSIDPDTDIFAITGLFLQNAFRRLPVVERDRVIGQVSRRDVLLAIEQMQRAAAVDTDRQFPDYRAPA